MRGISMFLKNCPICDSHRIKRTKGMVERKIHRKVIRIPQVIYWVCENCGEKIFFPDALQQMRTYVEQHADLEPESLQAL
jgi:YgiT-type zinc finger domain-containing protein